jgi:putative oxidoreductase
MNDIVVPELLEYGDWALFLLRVWIALLFGWSGWLHISNPRERGENIEMSPRATVVLGAVELGGAILLAIGLWDQLAAAALALVMVGAIYKKMLVWKTGLWGDDSGGWYDEVLYLICNLVIVVTGGGSVGL